MGTVSFLGVKCGRGDVLRRDLLKEAVQKDVSKNLICIHFNMYR
jgi:hypothetical protein